MLGPVSAIERTRCPICASGQPLDVIAELDAVWVSAPPVAVLPGYACVVARRHVEEPFHLPDNEMFAFWRESMAVARALSSLLEPRKMNYEIHGNSIPHLHLHLDPRCAGDPFEGRPIAMDAAFFTRTADDLRRMADALAAVGRGTSQTA
jgi:diadenosine tetraphosphate (Ap4A) HIT family hydrolase